MCVHQLSGLIILGYQCWNPCWNPHAASTPLAMKAVTRCLSLVFPHKNWISVSPEARSNADLEKGLGPELTVGGH